MLDLFNTEDPNQEIESVIVPLIGEKWRSFLDDNILYELSGMIKRLDSENKDLVPDKHTAFRIFRDLDPEDVKVCIVSQCPYPDGNADGYAFSCGQYRSRSIEQVLHAIADDTDLLEWDSISDGDPFPYDIKLDYLVKQGVMLLNIRLMIERGNTDSLKNIGWDKFTHHVINRLSHNQNVMFCLWGSEARKAEKVISKNDRVFTATHPVNRDQLQWDCKHFPVINYLLARKGERTISWLNPIQKPTGWS